MKTREQLIELKIRKELTSRHTHTQAMTERTLYDATAAARRLTANGNHWRAVVTYVAETYGVDPLSVAYYLGQWAAGTREASCVVNRVGRPVRERGDMSGRL